MKINKRGGETNEKKTKQKQTISTYRTSSSI